jgi:pilus assembly protein CpaD
LANTTANRQYFDYGCASQQNLAAMVADPLDLLYPRASSPADAERRGTVLEDYRNGDIYQSDYSRVTGGEVAQGVGQ